MIAFLGRGPWEEPEMRAAIDQFVRRRSPVIPALLAVTALQDGMS